HEERDCEDGERAPAVGRAHGCSLIRSGRWKTERFSIPTTIHKPKTDRYHVRMTTETNERVAELAAALFHEHGITATGVEALSKAAGISKRTLYEQFGSKDGLITAAFASWDEPVFERFTKPAERANT